MIYSQCCCAWSECSSWVTLLEMTTGFSGTRVVSLVKRAKRGKKEAHQMSALDDLYERLKAAESTLQKRVEAEPTNGRLHGKLQGIRLTLGYVLEAKVRRNQDGAVSICSTHQGSVAGCPRCHAEQGGSDA